MVESKSLQLSVEFIKGIGPQKAQALASELSIRTAAQLLTHYPFRYVDRSKIQMVAELRPDLAYVQLKGTLSNIKTIGEGRKQRLSAILSDNSGSVELVWFQSVQWIRQSVKAGVEYLVFGRASHFNGSFNLVHPDLELVGASAELKSQGLQAVYPTTEKLKSKGLDSKGFQKAISNTLECLNSPIPETFPEKLLHAFDLVSRHEALFNIHKPKDLAHLQRAQFRLKFEELFFIQLKLLFQKVLRGKENFGFVFPIIGNYFNYFYKNRLGFELTEAQKRVLKEIRADMSTGKQMNRLLQGDVGSGKTIVALMAMLIALDNKKQTTLMAPTEILATQHYEGIKPMLSDMGVEVALLTGSTKQSERKRIHLGLADGSIHILIGTHALIEESVQLKDLGLVVIDEQHRFGVQQRSKLWSKNNIYPHILVMTATPIPRTLAMTLYGDLDISVIDELPPGRKPIKTMHFYENARTRVYDAIKNQIDDGRQVYIVYPLIKESEKLDFKNLEEGYLQIQHIFSAPTYNISMVHGQLKAAEKEAQMQLFVQGKTQIMVATTVIEVGVNVPNASVMLIESAERFGLSQLHQLRGRVGRGADQSYCYLLSDVKLSADSKLRLETMVSTNDGFKLAEIDLKLRGPGDISGTKQSGILDLQLADLSKDAKILQLARNAAMAILAQDPDLEMSEHLTLKHILLNKGEGRTDWSRIS